MVKQTLRFLEPLFDVWTGILVLFLKMLILVVILGPLSFMEAAEQSIHNRNIEVKLHDLPWYNSHLSTLKRQVKRKTQMLNIKILIPMHVPFFCQALNYYQELLSPLR